MGKKWLFMALGAVLAVGSAILIPVPTGVKFTFVFLMLCGLALIVYSLIGILIDRGVWKRFLLVVKRLIQVCFCLWLLSFIVLECLIVVNGRGDDLTGRSHLVVLGAGLRGEEPSLILKSRLDRAAEFLEENPDATAILCGGQGVNEIIPESVVMYRYLRDRGIDESRLTMEDQSNDTAENLKNAKRLLEEQGASNQIVLLTNEFHLWRAKMLARRYGLDAAGLPASTPNQQFLKPNYYLREYFSMVIFWLESAGLNLDTSAIPL